MDIAAESDFTIETMEVDADHIHMLINSVPKNYLHYLLLNVLNLCQLIESGLTILLILVSIFGKNIRFGQTATLLRVLEMLVKKLLDNILNHRVSRSGAHSSDAPKESAVFCARTSINQELIRRIGVMLQL